MRTIDADALMESIGCADAVKYGNRDRVQQDISYRTMMLYEIRNEIDAQPTVGGWISVKDRLPAETHSIFWRLIGSKKWTNAMWCEQSDKVLVAVSFKDGTRYVTTGETHDGVWHTSISRTLEQEVTHWMQMPEPPEEVIGDE